MGEEQGRGDTHVRTLESERDILNGREGTGDRHIQTEKTDRPGAGSKATNAVHMIAKVTLCATLTLMPHAIRQERCVCVMCDV